MAKIILDTSKLNTSRPEVKEGLQIDLQRVQLLPELKDASAAMVTARNGIHFDSINYTVARGRMCDGRFVQEGMPREYGHESLPFLN